MNPTKFNVNILAAIYGKRPEVEKLTMGVTRGSLVALVGEPGMSKSYFALQWATGVAAGIRTLGNIILPPSKPLRVAYFTTEDSTDVLQQRLHDIWRAVPHGAIETGGISIETAARNLQENLTVAGWDGEDCDLFAEDTSDFEEAVVAEAKVKDVLMLDTFSDVFSGNENSTFDVRGFCNRLKRLAKECGVAILLVHHAGKSSGDGLYASRGSSVLPGKVRLQLNLSRMSSDEARKYSIKSEEEKDYVWLSKTKSSYGVLSSRRLLRRDSNGVLHACEHDESSASAKRLDPVKSLSSVYAGPVPAGSEGREYPLKETEVKTPEKPATKRAEIDWATLSGSELGDE